MCVAVSGCASDSLTSAGKTTPPPVDGGPRAQAADAAAAKDGGAGQPIVGADAGSTFACGPSGTLLCSCGSAVYFPAPTNDAGEAQTWGTRPDAAATDPYTTVAAFDALAVGRWRRTAGEGQLSCEQFGIDFTSDHRMIPLVIASDGSVQQVIERAISFGVSFANPNIAPAAFTDDGGPYANTPQFFDADQVMVLNYAPWPADYARVQ